MNTTQTAYDSLPSTMFRLGRRHLAWVLLGLIAGALGGLTLAASEGASQARRVFTFSDLSVVAERADLKESPGLEPQGLALRLNADAQATMGTAQTTVSFVGDRASRTVTASALAPTPALASAALEAAETRVRALALADFQPILSAAIASESEAVQIFEAALERSVGQGSQAPADADTSRILNNLAEHRSDLVNLNTYHDLLSSEWITSGEITSSAPGSGLGSLLASGLGAAIVIAGILGLIAAAPRVRRVMHIERAAPGETVLGAIPEPAKCQQRDVELLRMACLAQGSYPDGPLLEENDPGPVGIVDLGGDYGSDLADLLDTERFTYSESLDHGTLLVLVADSKVSRDEVSAFHAQLDSAGIDRLGWVLVGTPKPDLAWARARSESQV